MRNGTRSGKANYRLGTRTEITFVFCDEDLFINI